VLSKRVAGWLAFILGAVLWYLFGLVGVLIIVVAIYMLARRRRGKCKNCGAKWRKGQVYCTQCGAKLEQATPS
jgi:uncharacterized iron-regulated membrane protein